MSYTVWIAVDGDDDETGTWWSVNHFDTKEEAIEEAEDIASQYYARTGIEPERLED